MKKKIINLLHTDQAYSAIEIQQELGIEELIDIKNTLEDLVDEGVLKRTFAKVDDVKRAHYSIEEAS